MNEKEYLICLHWRGIFPENGDIVCKKCGGTGRYTYPSTCTWKMGVGGNMITDDVCDVCWGSGKLNEKGANLRLMRG